MFLSLKRGFLSAKSKFSQVSTSIKAVVSGSVLALSSEIASADTAADIATAFGAGQTNLSTAVTGLFTLLALVVAIGLIYKIMNK